jgi:hypothetical protein
VAANQRANAGAVGVQHALQVDDHVLVAGLEDLLDAPLQFFSRTSGDQRFLGREQQAVRLALF